MIFRHEVRDVSWGTLNEEETDLITTMEAIIDNRLKNELKPNSHIEQDCSHLNVRCRQHIIETYTNGKWNIYLETNSKNHKFIIS